MVRWITNTGIRYPFTFLPAIARGSGLSIDTLAVILSLRDLTGLAAPATGRAADRFGPGSVMVVFGWLSAAALCASVLGRYGLAVGFVIFGLAKIGFDVALNGWVGEEVAYHRRARVSGIVEMTWALAALIGLPVVGFLIDGFSWWLPALALAGASVPAVVSLARAFSMFPAHHVEHGRDRLSLAPLRRPDVIGAILAVGGLNLGSQLLIVAHGRWLEDTYGFDPTAVGFAIVAIGAVELVATLTSSRVADRLGKRRSVAAGGLVLALATLLLAIDPTPRLTLGLALLALAFLGFEFGFVSSLPLIAELDRKARSTIIGFVLGGTTLFRAIGSPLGTWLYNTGGWDRTMFGASIGTTTGVVILLSFVSEPGDGPDPASGRGVADG